MKEKHHNFSSENYLFYSRENCSILHGRVFVMKWIKAPLPLGFKIDKIYHEGNTSKMPYFDVLSLLDIRKRKTKPRGARKKCNFKRK